MLASENGGKYKIYNTNVILVAVYLKMPAYVSPVQEVCIFSPDIDLLFSVS